MNQKHNGQGYICPMHPKVRGSRPGTCPQCHMDLLPEGTRFGMIRHMMQRPLLLIAMVVTMGVMVLIMVMTRK